MVKLVLVAQLFLVSRTIAYIEWLVNEMIMTANKTEYKDAHLVMLLANAINPQARKPCISLKYFVFLLTGNSCRVQLSTQSLFYPVAGDRY
jgi:hypothetical protein